jgi:hypothetical protein
MKKPDYEGVMLNLSILSLIATLGIGLGAALLLFGLLNFFLVVVGCFPSHRSTADSLR